MGYEEQYETLDLFDISNNYDFEPDVKPPEIEQVKVRGRTKAINQYVKEKLVQGLKKREIVGLTFTYRYRKGRELRSEKIKITRSMYDVALKAMKEQLEKD